MKSFLLLRFVPTSTDVGLLIWRVLFGGLLCSLHGYGKLTAMSSMPAKFPDPLGMGHVASYWCTVGAEFLAALFIVFGLCTRWAALGAAFTMGVAFFVVHGASPKDGEMALLYLAGTLPLLFAGAGRFSLDAKIGGGGA